MRTVIVVIVGIAIGLALLWLLRRQRNAPATGLLVFGCLWLLACLYNLSVGVSHGYTVAAEMPYLLVNYLVPMGVVWALRNRIGKLHP